MLARTCLMTLSTSKPPLIVRYEFANKNDLVILLDSALVSCLQLIFLLLHSAMFMWHAPFENSGIMLFLFYRDVAYCTLSLFINF